MEMAIEYWSMWLSDPRQLVWSLRSATARDSKCSDEGKRRPIYAAHLTDPAVRRRWANFWSGARSSLSASVPRHHRKGILMKCNFNANRLAIAAGGNWNMGMCLPVVWPFEGTDCCANELEMGKICFSFWLWWLCKAHLGFVCCIPLNVPIRFW